MQSCVRHPPGSGSDDAAMQLIELRRLLETSACALRARRITPRDLELLSASIAEMREIRKSGNLAGFVAADLAVHDAIRWASGKVFLTILFQPVQRLFEENVVEKSRAPGTRELATLMHQRVLAALETGESRAAREAMDEHMTYTATIW
ncbi:FadR/GntR family transcriptional regulator [Sinomonas humi]|uniref:FadR/GntR family transcriptional regulator n=1 Tax=Sinomonas humi TaxID=1338436 RepID=UPI001E42EA43|nr:FCD domain-containing protein [Sinomonas humi]